LRTTVSLAHNGYGTVAHLAALGQLGPLPRNRQFYENMFGAEVSRSLYPAGTPFAGQPRITMKLGGTSFFVAPTDPRAPNGDPPKAPHFGLEHIGLTVDNLDAAPGELKSKATHFTVEPVTFTPGTKIAFVQAPQGVLVELIQRDR